MESIDDQNLTSFQRTSKKLLEMSQNYKRQHIYHIFILSLRSFKLILREPHLSWIRIGVSLVVGLFIGLLFGEELGQVGGCQPRKEVLYSAKPTDLHKDFEFEHRAIEENLGSIFFNTVFLMFGGMMPMIMVFPNEFNVLIKHYTNGWYSTFTYYLSKFITDLPINALGELFLLISFILI